jgi:hypothetical protein
MPCDRWQGQARLSTLVYDDFDILRGDTCQVAQYTSDEYTAGKVSLALQ